MRRFLLMCVAGAAFACCVLSVWVSCEFVKIETDTGFISSLGVYEFLYRQQECYSYTEIEKLGEDIIDFSATGKTAQVMGLLATIFGGIACLLLIFGSCFLSFFSTAKPLWRKLLGGSLLGAAICQSLTLLLLAEVNKGGWCDEPGHNCKMALGGILSCISFGLYFLASLAFWYLGLQPPKENPGTTFLARFGNDMMAKMGITWKSAWNLRAADYGLLIYSVILLALSFDVLLSCHFFVVTFGSTGSREYTEGLLFYNYYPDDTCRAFERGDYSSFTGATYAAIAFGCLAVVLGAVILCYVFSMILLVNYPLGFYKVLPALSFSAGVCQALTFLANSERNNNLCREDIEDQHCSLGPDAIVAVVNTCLYVLFVPALLWYANNPNIQLPEEGDAPLEKEGVEEQGGEEPPMVQQEDAKSPKDE